MIRSIFVVSLHLLILSFARAEDVAHYCPQTGEEWEIVRKDFFMPTVSISAEGQPKTPVQIQKQKFSDYLNSHSDSGQTVNDLILGCISAVKKDQTQDPQVLRCLVKLENQLNFYKSIGGKEKFKSALSDNLGYSVSNDEYMKNNEQDIGVGAIPERIKNAKFLKNIQNSKGLTEEIDKLRAEQVNKPENEKWRILQFKSHDRGLEGGGQGKMGRLLITIPGKECDEFYQIVTPSPEMVWETSQLSQYSLVKVCHTKAGKPLPKSQVLFQDFWRTGDNKDQMTTTHALGRTNQNCASCHSNGFLLPNIDESLSKLSPTDEKEYDYLKNYTSKFRPPNFVSRDEKGVFQTVLASEQMGAPIGQFKSEQERSDILDQCIGPKGMITNEMTPEAKKEIRSLNSMRGKVSNFMNCTSCHDGTMRGTLQIGNLSKLAGAEKKLMSSYLMNPRLHKIMNLNEQERQKLNSCFELELETLNHKDEFNKYMTQIPCGKAPTEDAKACIDIGTDSDPLNAILGVTNTPIHNADKSVTYTVDDPLNKELPNTIIVKNPDGSFSREIFTSVCHDGAGACYPIRFELQFDKEGNYKDMIPMPPMPGDQHTFTKVNHEKFSQDDFAILKKSIEAEVKKENRPLEKKPVGVVTDGMTGATLLSTESAYGTVPGAAYTTFKVVEYAVNTKQEIKKLSLLKK